uniref:Uncharacterized protein n=1 Tax=Lactuca sativa TaxID=4236 RepID=A0A9R1X042_LACSA|nr:hypothetical protein LSAT_V11C800404290 [Lactuca sativa]
MVTFAILNCTNRQIARKSTIRAFYAMYVMIRWWMMYDSAMNGRNSIHNVVYKSDTTSLVNIRMNRNAFTRLCDMFGQIGGLKNSKNIFKRSVETVSRYFKLVLDAICRLHKEFCMKPFPILDDDTEERWRWFKDGRVQQQVVEYCEMLLVDHMVLKYLMEHTTFVMWVYEW